MVTSYYIMKLSSNKFNTDIAKHYCNLNNQCHFKRNINLNSKICRVCLNDGDVDVSLYNVENNSDIIEALQRFGDIDLNESEFPKYLCSICFKFISSAILFRKIAKQTNHTLKQPIKEEAQSDNLDFSNDSSDDIDSKDASVHFKDADVKEMTIKSSNVNKIKLSMKVQCNICNKIVNRSYYKEHMTMHDPNHYKYVCDVCGKSFRLRCAYHNHSLRHRNDFLYKCQFCPYKAKYAELLKTHMRTHTGDYRYMCTECPARFLFKSNLNSHMFKHKEPQYKCESCKRAFHTKILLKRHFDADHLGIKNNVCNICGKAFGYRNAMMKHQRQVHKRAKLSFARMPSYLKAEHISGNNI